MTDDEVAAIGARAEAAAWGPWTATGTYVFSGFTPMCKTTQRDLEFITRARTDVPALVAEVQRLRALVAALVSEPS